MNTVNPTVVMTPMGKANWSDPLKAKTMLDRIPLGRFAGESAEPSGAGGYGGAQACLGEEGGSFLHPAPTLPAEVQDVVDAILFLLSDCSSMTTGSAVPVDGGFLAT